MIAVWWPKLRDSEMTRTRLSSLRDLAEDLRRRVGRAVVDDDELPRQPVDGRADALVERARRPLLVEHRRDDAQQGQIAVGHGVIVFGIFGSRPAAVRTSRDTLRRVTCCAACGASGLVPHLKVAGDAGPDGLIPTTDKFGTALADIVRCPSCGHRQTDPMPADAVLESAYADAASEDYVAEEAGQRETARRALEHIEANLTPVPIPPTNGGPRHRTLLDLGCWVGFLLSEAEERGWAVTGVEPSAFASQFARERLGLDVRTGGLFETELPQRALRRDRHGRRHRAPAAPRRRAGPDGRAAAPRRDRLDGAARRRQPRRARDARALVVGDPDARAVLHAPLAAHAAGAPRLDGARDRDRAEGVQRALLPRPRRRLLAGPRAGARARRAGGAARRPHVGAGLPRPHGGHRAGAVAGHGRRRARS